MLLAFPPLHAAYTRMHTPHNVLLRCASSWRCGGISRISVGRRKVPNQAAPAESQAGGTFPSLPEVAEHLEQGGWTMKTVILFQCLLILLVWQQ